jgi:hypothetical protein
VTARKKQPPRVRVPKPRAVPTTSYADERRAALAQIRAAKLPATERAAWERALRPAIRIYTRRVADDALPIGASHLGGEPDLPDGSSWPHADGFPMSFVAQLRLDEVAPFDRERELPDAGLLSFFVFDTCPLKAKAPRWYSRHLVLYTASVATLRRARTPPEVFVLRTRKDRRPSPTAACAFHVELDLPSRSAVKLPRPATYTQLLGHDDHRGYDDPLPPGTRNLFRCESDDQADLNFGDAQDLAFRIADDDLRARRFDRATVWMQVG